MCDSNVTEERVSISSETNVLHTIIVHTYGFTFVRAQDRQIEETRD